MTHDPRLSAPCASLCCSRQWCRAVPERELRGCDATSSAASTRRRTTSACSGGTARARPTRPFRRWPRPEGARADTDLRDERRDVRRRFFADRALCRGGQELAPVNTKTVSGEPGQIPNFYKKPNGVFYLAGKARGRDDDRCVARVTAEGAASPRSPGPMLVIDGKIHPAFIEGSTDLKPRDGVGVRVRRQGAFRHHRGRREFLRFRALLPRQARLRRTRSSSTADRRPGSMRRNSTVPTRPATAATGRSSGWSRRP